MNLGVSWPRDESASLHGAESEEYENWFTRCIYVDEKMRDSSPLFLLATPFSAIRYVSRNRDLSRTSCLNRRRDLNDLNDLRESGSSVSNRCVGRSRLIGIRTKFLEAARGGNVMNRIPNTSLASADRSSGRVEKKDPAGDHRPGNVSPRRRISRSVGENDEAE